MTYALRAISLTLLALVLSACSNQEDTLSRTTQATPSYQQPVERVVEPYLTQEYAAMRAEQVSDVDYTLSFVLSDERDTFAGDARISFTLAQKNAADLTVDFNGGEVESVRLNQEPVEWDYNGYFITVDAGLLPAGENTLAISYTRPYSRDGDGLYRYTDAETGNQYLYTNFEPYNANKLFPHFDQPNIKARYTVDVKAPAEWTVVSAVRESRVDELADMKVWHFPQTARISSYIFPLHAGPWHVWEDTYVDEANGITIPLRLFARRELAEHVVVEDWFTFTKQSFGFFNDYFELPYMFGKYDQLIVPDFNAGAMENLAAVTFTERFVVRGQKVESQRMRLANVIAHEMAHMWFGNLVTMNWWNGLWLNESFATYMANLEVARASEFENTWDTFYSGTKQWAYETDQQVTTHPIELPVPTTADAFTNFDGITYGKGASVLKQLPYYLGEENFRRGVANYLKKHSYGNTELEDFTSALAEAADMDLTEWKQEWLFEEGLNSVRPEYSCNDGDLTALKLVQTAPEDHPTLRAQRTIVGLFSIDEGTAELIDEIPVTYEGETTVVDVPEDTACPDLVYPNVEDWAYVKVQLDEKSRETLRNNIHAFQNESLRIMLWQSLWDSVLDVEWPLTDFVAFATNKLPAEDSDRIISQVAEQLTQAYRYLWLMDPQARRYEAERHAIADMLWQQTLTAPGYSDAQKIWFDHWAAVAGSEPELKKAQALLKNQLDIDGFVLDQDRRWALVLLLNRFAYGDYRELTQAELERDSSAVGQQSFLAAQATRPEKAVKEEWLSDITAPVSKYSLAELRAVMAELFPPSQAPLLSAFGDEILSALPELAEDKEERFLSLYTRYLLPETCDEQSVARLAQAKEAYANLSPALHKALRIAHQLDQRCVNMKELM